MFEAGTEARAPQTRRGEGARFARRMYVPRVVGLAAGAVCVAGGLWQRDAHVAWYAVLLLFTVVWPHVAYRLAVASHTPYRRELRNLVIDSTIGGLFIGAIGFNLVPSAVLVSMLSMDKLAVGGLPFLARCATAQAAAAVIAFAVIGFDLELVTGLPAMLATLPLLMAYPSAVGVNFYWLSRRVRQQNQLLAATSRVDALSGLLNRSNWEQAVAAEFRVCRGDGRTSAVLMIDVDHFKNINDTYGHPVGDEAIRAVADLLSESVREHDVVGRYGGEEFGVLLTGAESAVAAAAAERIRARMEQTTLVPEHGIKTTLSVGIAACADDDEDPISWIKRADRALYVAKHLGRNRVIDAKDLAT